MDYSKLTMYLFRIILGTAQCYPLRSPYDMDPTGPWHEKVKVILKAKSWWILDGMNNLPSHRFQNRLATVTVTGVLFNYGYPEGERGFSVLVTQVSWPVVRVTEEC